MLIYWIEDPKELQIVHNCYGSLFEIDCVETVRVLLAQITHGQTIPSEKAYEFFKQKGNYLKSKCKKDEALAAFVLEGILELFAANKILQSDGFYFIKWLKAGKFPTDQDSGISLANSIISMHNSIVWSC